MKEFIDKISPFIVMDILVKARAMPDAVHMEVGEPDLPPPGRVTEAYIKAIKDKQFHYTASKGLKELREKISEYYCRKYNVSVSPERIIITPGTSGAFLVVFALLTDSGRRLVLSDPSYPCYRNFAYFLRTDPVFVPVGKDTNYEISPKTALIPDNAGALVVSSPSNPMGNLYSEESIKELVRLSEERGFRFISDEIYHGLVYGGQEHTALEFSDKVVVINSFSKYFCMPGFRVGWMILPEELVRKAEIIAQNIFIAANTPAQYAAVEAFDDEYLGYVRNTYKQRRDFLYNELKDIFQIDAVPDGAFYIWADISRYSNDSLRFCRQLLDEKSVAVTPGVDFGNNRTAHHMRFAYTQDISRLKEGVERIKEFLSGYRGTSSK
ncbi:MAG: aminotransferase class I/II-fold pyridoxal phosphate-dependent enzyme [Nitrospirota bacterium]